MLNPEAYLPTDHLEGQLRQIKDTNALYEQVCEIWPNGIPSATYIKRTKDNGIEIGINCEALGYSEFLEGIDNIKHTKIFHLLNAEKDFDFSGIHGDYIVPCFDFYLKPDWEKQLGDEARLKFPTMKAEAFCSGRLVVDMLEGGQGYLGYEEGRFDCYATMYSMVKGRKVAWSFKLSPKTTKKLLCDSLIIKTTSKSKTLGLLP